MLRRVTNKMDKKLKPIEELSELGFVDGIAREATHTHCTPGFLYITAKDMGLYVEYTATGRLKNGGWLIDKSSGMQNGDTPAATILTRSQMAEKIFSQFEEEGYENVNEVLQKKFVDELLKVNEATIDKDDYTKELTELSKMRAQRDDETFEMALKRNVAMLKRVHGKESYFVVKPSLREMKKLFNYVLEETFQNEPIDMKKLGACELLNYEFAKHYGFDKPIVKAKKIASKEKPAFTKVSQKELVSIINASTNCYINPEDETIHCSNETMKKWIEKNAFEEAM